MGCQLSRVVNTAQEPGALPLTLLGRNESTPSKGSLTPYAGSGEVVSGDGMESRGAHQAGGEVEQSSVTLTSSRTPRAAVVNGQERPSTNVSPRPTVDFRWRLSQLIGSGSFGSVYLGLNIHSGALLAVKVIQFNAKNAKYVSQVQQEIELLRTLSHENIVKYEGATMLGDDTLYLFMEWVSGGSVCVLLDLFHKLAEKAVRNYVKQILQGLAYLHAQNVIHRDIKGANILIDETGRVKLTDFGASLDLARLANTNEAGMSDATPFVGTPQFLAPEIIELGVYSDKSDVWSVGCTMVQMLTGKLPWSHINASINLPQLLHAIRTTQTGPPLPARISDAARDFLQACFSPDPLSRPTAAQLLEHPFILNINQDDVTGVEAPVTSEREVFLQDGSDISSQADSSQFMVDGKVRFRRVAISVTASSAGCRSDDSMSFAERDVHQQRSTGARLPEHSPQTSGDSASPSPECVFILDRELTELVGVPIYLDPESNHLKTYPQFMPQLLAFVQQAKEAEQKAATDRHSFALALPVRASPMVTAPPAQTPVKLPEMPPRVFQGQESAPSISPPKSMFQAPASMALAIGGRTSTALSPAITAPPIVTISTTTTTPLISERTGATDVPLSLEKPEDDELIVADTDVIPNIEEQDGLVGASESTAFDRAALTQFGGYVVTSESTTKP